MKKLLAVAILMLTIGCSSLTPKEVESAKDATKVGLSLVQKACVFANAFLPRTKLAEWCHIGDPYLRALDELLPAAVAGREAVLRSSGIAGASPPKLMVCSGLRVDAHEDAADVVTCREAP